MTPPVPSRAVDPPVVHGRIITFAWDYGIGMPLWDDSGPLLEDGAWLAEALGISDRLIHDLAAWGQAMIDLDVVAPLRTRSAYAILDRRARELVERLRGEIDGRWVVDYRPW